LVFFIKRLAHHRARVHGGVDLVAGAVQEAGVDEGHARRGLGDAGLEVDAGAALLVHDAQLDGVLRQAQQRLDAAEQQRCERGFGRAVHLGLDDVDRALARVLDAGLVAALQVVDGDGRGDHRVQDAFGDFLAAVVQDGRVGHQVADIAHEHQRAAVQAHLAAGGALVFAVGVQAAREGLAALLHFSVSVPCRMPSQLE
jgi:hypothetical protein